MFFTYLGPPLPSDRFGAKLVTTPEGDGVLLFGGRNLASEPDNNLDEILLLKADGSGFVGSWTTLEAKLQYARYWHVVIPICMEKDYCGLSGIVPCPTTSGRYIQINNKNQNHKFL